jgi:hypothetical protein
LKSFPRGLGKGFDAALVGAWLERVVKDVPTNSDLIPETGHVWHFGDVASLHFVYLFPSKENKNTIWVLVLPSLHLRMNTVSSTL